MRAAKAFWSLHVSAQAFFARQSDTEYQCLWMIGDFSSLYMGTAHVKWAAPRDFQQCSMCDQQNLRSASAYAQSDQSLCWSLEYSMSVMLLTEHHLEFLSLKGGCTGSSESTIVKIPHCWKSHVVAQVVKCQMELFSFLVLSTASINIYSSCL